MFFFLNDGSIAGAQPAPSAADCEQIRQAVALYGYAAVKEYALAHYPKEVVMRYGALCLGGVHAIKVVAGQPRS